MRYTLEGCRWRPRRCHTCAQSCCLVLAVQGRGWRDMRGEGMAEVAMRKDRWNMDGVKEEKGC